MPASRQTGQVSVHFKSPHTPGSDGCFGGQFPIEPFVAISVTSRPYGELHDYVAAHPEARQAILDTLAYFDPWHFAPSIQYPTLVNVGMRDDVCPATTILPVIERITAPKPLHVYPDLTHTPCTDFNAHAMHWLRRYLGA
jgi:cephalosporin-C deacetylase-like acetyl esterase